MKFGFGQHGEEGDNRRSEREGREQSSPKSRHSHENHVNVHTECGRHGDDWLFGGWNIGGVVKRVLGKGD